MGRSATPAAFSPSLRLPGKRTNGRWVNAQICFHVVCMGRLGQELPLVNSTWSTCHLPTRCNAIALLVILNKINCYGRDSYVYGGKGSRVDIDIATDVRHMMICTSIIQHQRFRSANRGPRRRDPDLPLESPLGPRFLGRKPAAGTVPLKVSTYTPLLFLLPPLLTLAWPVVGRPQCPIAKLKVGLHVPR